jgi:predicted deacylase
MEAKIKMDTVEDAEYNVPPNTEYSTSESSTPTKRKKKSIVTVIVIVLVTICMVLSIAVYRGAFLSEFDKMTNIMIAYELEGYDAAEGLINRYYSGTKAKTLIAELSEYRLNELRNEISRYK